MLSFYSRELEMTKINNRRDALRRTPIREVKAFRTEGEYGRYAGTWFWFDRAGATVTRISGYANTTLIPWREEFDEWTLGDFLRKYGLYPREWIVSITKLPKLEEDADW